MDRDEVYLERDNRAIMFNRGKGRNIHSCGCNMVKNNSTLNSLEKLINVDNDIGSIGHFYPDGLHGRYVPLHFFEDNIPPIQRLYNHYQMGDGMRVFIPKYTSREKINHIINTIYNLGAENVGYKIYGDNILPKYLNYEDMLTLSQFT